MKILYHIILTAVLVSLFNISSAQINWKSLESKQKHIINLNIGLDNATSIGIGYGYKTSTRMFKTTMPMIFNVEYSMPVGKDLFDDLKTKIGGQINVIRANNFYATAKVYGVIRRYENDFTRMMNFGSELSGVFGFYKNKWYAAGEFGFDKAITTHIKHSKLMKEYNPDVQSGWYIPTGGNFIYNLQGGYSFKRNDVYAKVGRSISQDFKTLPTMPWQLQLGWNMKL
jgi:hypothetical protein